MTIMPFLFGESHSTQCYGSKYRRPAADGRYYLSPPQIGPTSLVRAYCKALLDPDNFQHRDGAYDIGVYAPCTMPPGLAAQLGH